MRWYVPILLLVLMGFGTNAIIVPDEIPTALSVIYSNIPKIKLGTDSRIGWGFRFGDRADAQILLELGPQQYTQRLANQQLFDNPNYPELTSSPDAEDDYGSYDETPEEKNDDFDAESQRKNETEILQVEIKTMDNLLTKLTDSVKNETEADEEKEVFENLIDTVQVKIEKEKSKLENLVNHTTQENITANNELKEIISKLKLYVEKNTEAPKTDTDDVNIIEIDTLKKLIHRLISLSDSSTYQQPKEKNEQITIESHHQTVLRTKKTSPDEKEEAQVENYIKNSDEHSKKDNEKFEDFTNETREDKNKSVEAKEEVEVYFSNKTKMNNDQHDGIENIETRLTNDTIYKAVEPEVKVTISGNQDSKKGEFTEVNRDLRPNKYVINKQDFHGGEMKNNFEMDTNISQQKENNYNYNLNKTETLLNDNKPTEIQNQLDFSGKIENSTQSKNQQNPKVKEQEKGIDETEKENAELLTNKNKENSSQTQLNLSEITRLKNESEIKSEHLEITTKSEKENESSSTHHIEDDMLESALQKLKIELGKQLQNLNSESQKQEFFKKLKLLKILEDEKTKKNINKLNTNSFKDVMLESSNKGVSLKAYETLSSLWSTNHKFNKTSTTALKRSANTDSTIHQTKTVHDNTERNHNITMEKKSNSYTKKLTEVYKLNKTQSKIGKQQEIVKPLREASKTDSIQEKIGKILHLTMKAMVKATSPKLNTTITKFSKPPSVDEIMGKGYKIMMKKMNSVKKMNNISYEQLTKSANKTNQTKFGKGIKVNNFETKPINKQTDISMENEYKMTMMAMNNARKSNNNLKIDNQQKIRINKSYATSMQQKKVNMLTHGIKESERKEMGSLKQNSTNVDEEYKKTMQAMMKSRTQRNNVEVITSKATKIHTTRTNQVQNNASTNLKLLGTKMVSYFSKMIQDAKKMNQQKKMTRKKW